MRWHLSQSIARRVGFAALIASTTGLSGCCTMARLFCGPDGSKWVSERFDTPLTALATFQESLRRADRQTLLRCLSESFKERMGGLGTLEIEIAWRRLSDQIPGIHLLGTAEVEGPRVLADGRIAYVLRVAGRALSVTLTRQTYWEVRWVEGTAPDDPIEDGAYGALEPVAEVRPGAGGGVHIVVDLPPVSGPTGLQDLTFAGIGAQWKVDAIDRYDGDD